MFYDENLIDSYINKSPILNRKGLENDPNFMLNVIKKTNDKMFYYLDSLDRMTHYMGLAQIV